MRNDNFTYGRLTKILAVVLAALTALAVFPLMPLLAMSESSRSSESAETLDESQNGETMTGTPQPAEQLDADGDVPLGAPGIMPIASGTTIVFDLNADGIAYSDAEASVFYFANVEGELYILGADQEQLNGGETLTISGVKYQVAKDDAQKKVTLTASTALPTASCTFYVTSVATTPMEVSYTVGDVKTTLVTILPDEQFVRTNVPKISGKSITISAQAVSPSYRINFLAETGTGWHVDYQTAQVTENGTYKFSVITDAGYAPSVKYRSEGSSYKDLAIAKQDGKDYTEVEGGWKYDFEISNVTADTTVSISVASAKVNVTVNESDQSGYIASGLSSKTVDYNGTFSFTLAPKAGYEAPTVTWKKTSGDGVETTVNPVGNTYTIENITEPITVTVTPAKRTQYTVTLKGVTGATITATYGSSQTITGSGSVESGTVITVKVSLSPEYSQSTPTVSLSNGDHLELENKGGTFEGTYTVNGTVAISVDASSVVLNKYEVTVSKSGNGYSTTANNTQVTHGTQYSFTVTKNEGYEFPEVAIKKSNGQTPLTNEEYSVSTNGDTRTYTVFSAVENLTVTIGAANKRQVSVKVPSEPRGFTITVTKEGSQKVEDQVEYGTELTITIQLLEGYTNSDPTVYINSAPVSMNRGEESKLSYQITANADITISVTGVVLNTYTVTVPPAETGYTIDKTNTPVVHDGSYQFTINVSAGYVVSDYNDDFVTVDGDAIVEVKANGSNTAFTVTISNITDDVNVTIDSSKVSRITYTVTADDGENYQITVNKQLDYGNTNTPVDVKPNAGYKVDYVEYSVNGSPSGRLTRGEGSTSSNVHFTLPSVNGNVTITVHVSPIMVTVEYTYGDIKMLGQTFINGDVVTRNYTIAKDDGNLDLTVEGNKLQFALPTADKWQNEGFELTDQGFTSKNGTAEDGKFTLSTADLNSDCTVVVNCAWTVYKDGVAEKVVFHEVAVEQPKKNEEDGSQTAKWSTTFDFGDLDDELTAKLNEGVVTAWGFIYNSVDINELIKTENFLNWLVELDGSAVYNTYAEDVKAMAKYYKIDEDDNVKFDEALTFSESITYTKSGLKQETEIWGAFWLKVNLDGHEYVIVSEAKSVTFTPDPAAIPSKQSNG